MKRFSILRICYLFFLQINAFAQIPQISFDESFNTFDNNEISIVNAFVKQNDKLIMAGSFRKIAGQKCSNICRLLNDSVADPSFNSGTGFNNEVKKVVVLPGSKLLVMGAFTTYSNVNMNYLMRLNADGTPDLTFVPNFDFGSVLNDFVVQSDGMVVVVGQFTTYSGYPRKNIVRLKSNGNLDLSFNCGDINNGNFNKVLLQSTGKIILTGEFNTYQSYPASSIVRLLSNGNVDNTFSCALQINYYDTNYHPYVLIRNIHVHKNDEISISHDGYPTDDIFCRYNSDGGLISKYPFKITSKSIFLENGNILHAEDLPNGNAFPQEIAANGNTIKRYAAQGWIGYIWDRQTTVYGNNSYPLPIFEIDGRIYFSCNYYENYTPTSRKFIRFGIDNGIDEHFLPVGGPDFSVTSMAKYTSDKLVILGGFSRVGTTSVNSIALVDTTCKVISSFKPGAGFNGPALCVAVQQDGKILVGGDFTSYNNQSANRLVRLLPDGSIDQTFVVGSGTDYPVYDIHIVDGDKILIAGVFGTYQGVEASNIVCLNFDGSMNSNFNANIGSGTNGRVRKLHSSDTHIYVIGDFNYFNGNLRKHVFRINLDGSFDPTFDVGQGDNGQLNDVAVLGNKIYAVGGFTSFSNVAIGSMARLNLDGSIDATYTSYDNQPISGFNVEVLDNTLLFSGVDYSSFNTGSMLTQSSSSQAYALTDQNGYFSRQGLYGGLLPYWPEFSSDSGSYYLKHLKILVDGSNIYFYGGFVNESRQSTRENFIIKYTYTPPVVDQSNNNGGNSGNGNNGGNGGTNLNPPNNLYYTFSNHQIILNDINDSKGLLYLSDVNGGVIRSGDYQTNTGIDIQSLNPGMYFIKYINENQTDVTTIKLIIN